MNVLKFFLIFFWLSDFGISQVAKQGKFLNPITDINWGGVGPIVIAKHLKFLDGSGAINPIDNPDKAMKMCGIPCATLCFWDPMYLVEVTDIPFVFVSLGGLKLGGQNPQMKGVGTSGSGHMQSGFFSNVHVLKFPILSFLDLIVDVSLLEERKFEIPYISEFDPTWNREKLGILVHFEALLFNNPIAQAACGFEAAMIAVRKKPIEKLFWCAGGQGSMYPLTGASASHTTILSSHALLMQRALFKMQKYGMISRTAPEGDFLCKREDAKLDPLIFAKAV